MFSKKAKSKKNTNIDYADVLLPRLIFILSTLALLLFGLVMIYSASNAEAIDNGESYYSYLIKQGGFCLVGILIAVFIWKKIPYDFWRSNLIWFFLGFSILLLILTLAFGTDTNGARRWVGTGGLKFQPSEFVKVILILATAKIYFDYVDGHQNFKKSLILGVLINLTCLGFILVAQSDLGTCIIITVGIISVLYFAGVSKRIIFGLILLIIGLGLLCIIVAPYRLTRLAIFLDPYNDGNGGLGDGYQYVRSRYALADGGLFGVGLGNSYEKYQYLPEAETDYIFAVICEELGLLGGMFVCILFLVFIISGLFTIRTSRNSFAISSSSSLIMMIGVQAFINIFCVVGLFPTTGKPLPFISYGGSSVIATLVMVGIVLSSSHIATNKQKTYERKASSFTLITDDKQKRRQRRERYKRTSLSSNNNRRSHTRNKQ